MLRSLYGVVDASKLMYEMVDCVEVSEKDSLMPYVYKMNGYGRNIMSTTSLEDCPLPERMVRKRYTESLLNGLRRATVSLELKLCYRGVPDHELMEVVREITAREEENKRKFGLKASAKAVEGDFCTRDEGEILALMNKLSTQLDEQNLTSDRQQKTIG